MTLDSLIRGLGLFRVTIQALERCASDNEANAIFAVAHSMLMIICHVLANHCDYHDLGADYFERRNDSAAQTRRRVRQLKSLAIESPSHPPTDQTHDDRSMVLQSPPIHASP